MFRWRTDLGTCGSFLEFRPVVLWGLIAAYPPSRTGWAWPPFHSGPTPPVVPCHRGPESASIKLSLHAATVVLHRKRKAFASGAIEPRHDRGWDGGRRPSRFGFGLANAAAPEMDFNSAVLYFELMTHFSYTGSVQQMHGATSGVSAPNRSAARVTRDGFARPA